MAIFPGAISTDSDLYVAVNNKTTQLTDNPLTIGATTANVVSTSGFPTVGFISIDGEIIKYTGVTGTSFTGLSRGQDGTAASSHVQNSQVYHNVIAIHHNVLKDEIKATEQFISDLIGRTNTQVRAPDGAVGSPAISFASALTTGMYKTGANSLRFASGGVNIFSAAAGNLEIDSGVIVNLDGTAALPTYTFGTDPTMGLYRAAANQLGISVGGVLRMRVVTSGVNIDSGSLFLNAAGGVIQNQDGTALLPSYAFANDPDTGIYRVGSGAWDFTSNGVSTVRFQASGIQMNAGIIRSQFGTAANPTYTFDGDEDTGMFHSATNVLGFSSNGSPTCTMGSYIVSLQSGFAAPNGSVATPGFAFDTDVDTGLAHLTTNNFSAIAGGTLAATFKPSGAADGTTYQPFSLHGGNVFGGGGTTNSMDTFIRTTASVGTSASIIGPTVYGLAIVQGIQGTQIFTDLLLMHYNTGTVVVVASKTQNAPATRTYSQSSDQLTLQMGSGAYSISFFALSCPIR